MIDYTPRPITCPHCNARTNHRRLQPPDAYTGRRWACPSCTLNNPEPHTREKP